MPANYLMVMMISTTVENAVLILSCTIKEFFFSSKKERNKLFNSLRVSSCMFIVLYIRIVVGLEKHHTYAQQRKYIRRVLKVDQV